MKKDLLLLLFVLLVVAVLVQGVDILSVDEYYLLHQDDLETASATVTLSIRCDTAVASDRLDEALREGEFLPADGVLFPETRLALRPGDSVFDLLERAVRKNRLQMEVQGAEKSPFGSVYVQGIGYLYEFSCGPLSGWMYRVNGQFPTYGCSAYYPKDGDVIEWVYTCDLGRDVGCAWLGKQK